MATLSQMPPLEQLAITGRVAVTCVGRGREAHVDAMSSGRSGLTACDFPGVDFPCWIGRVGGIEDELFPGRMAAYENRATRLAVSALETEGFSCRVAAAISRWGSRRVGLVIGTSTSGVEKLENVYRNWSGNGPLDPAYSLRHHNDHHAVTSFLAEYLGIEGIGYTVSTACSSAAKALIDGAQLIRLGLCDAVLTGGVDSLCLTSLFGFEALELVSREPCRPFDARRDGLSIGEGAGFILLEREGDGPRLLGYGETSDAVSMSTPPPEGEGAQAAMREALGRASLDPEEIEFVKLHGTATKSNDLAESAAVASIFPFGPPSASLKGMIGHTLGAAGAVEAVLCLDAMESGIVPGTVGLSAPDPALALVPRIQSASGEIRRAVCNAFGFGGSNSSLVLGLS
ncbi:beta-ketoacyl-ACP synthase [Limibaculum sp. M0105]|uniref:Beta-ketoacyl-ACP synthase n=1 Tax=Thermohalobaculum xanthum TaxID=2753746 RepID=A0A8J7MAM5_9RHOB|nr:beta-ketoacyl-ACP synthase [Thermohalobaculum xanthum]MBK0400875.1 beta-ketoacyl-ACP synthase [Thermohalobaculum xanthum]